MPRHEVLEVVFDFGMRAARNVRYGGQQDGVLVVQISQSFGVAFLQGGIPVVEQGGDFGFDGFFAKGRIAAVCGRFREQAGRGRIGCIT